ncbi:hypothetical protein LXA43DRAFT_990958 [Ganoderma leucocontextum]|nr:hypothetical protein LXA43DRAFT_990958 [Ganoderma leucocontextum]
MNENGPPSYNDDRARAELKHKFTMLVKDQQDIQELFKTIARELQATPEIGDKHPLLTEWEALRERHRQTYNKSRHNASWCSRYLENFAKTMIPLSISKDLPEKKEMIRLFLEAIGVHLEAAKENMDGFSQLARDVEAFPPKVARVIRIANITSWGEDLFGMVCAGIEKLWNSIWQMLTGLLTNLAYVLDAALARLGRVSFSYCGGSIDFWINPYGSLREELKPYRPIKSEPVDNYDMLQDKLTGFESAWQLVHLKCSQLLADVELAQSFSNSDLPIPQAVDTHLEAAAATALDESLIECLRAYSKSESPNIP